MNNLNPFESHLSMHWQYENIIFWLFVILLTILRKFQKKLYWVEMKTQKSLPPTHASPPTEHLPFTAEVQQLATILQALRGLGANSPPPPKPPNEEPPGAAWAQHVVDALLKRLYRRVPKPGDKKRSRLPESCPFSGLNHSQIYQAMEPRPDGRPLIQSVSLKEPGENSAARFYSVRSALEYMDYLAELQARGTENEKGSP